MLLSLIPPSCIVASSSELVNIHTSTSTFNSKLSQMDRTSANVAIDIDSNIIRRRSNFSGSISSKSALISSKASSMLYHKKMEINNSLPNKEFVNFIDNSQLSYKDNDGAGNLVRKVTDTNSIRNQQCIQGKGVAPKNTSTTQGKSTSQHCTNMS